MFKRNFAFLVVLTMLFSLVTISAPIAVTASEPPEYEWIQSIASPQNELLKGGSLRTFNGGNEAGGSASYANAFTDDLSTSWKSVSGATGDIFTRVQLSTANGGPFSNIQNKTKARHKQWCCDLVYKKRGLKW